MDEQLYETVIAEINVQFGDDVGLVERRECAEMIVEALETVGYRKVDEVQRGKAKEILSGLVRWLKGAIDYSFDKALREQGPAYYGGKNNAFHEMLDLVKQVAEKEGVEVDE